MTDNAFPEIGFLSDASDQLKRVLTSLSSEISLAPGEILFEQGDDGDALYAIIYGALEFSVLSEDGRKLSLDVMRDGALFGEIALFDPGPRTATVTALEPSLLARVRNQDVLKGVRDTPELAVDLIRLAGLRMRWMNMQLSEQVFLPVPTRLARKILHLTGPEGTGLSLSQAELAEFVGATREAVSKTISGWRKTGVVQATRGGLQVLNRGALEALAGYDQF
ncbi:MAG: Crp/Fnr family transcriptional regulator [Paracoccaceae bacterium]